MSEIDKNSYLEVIKGVESIRAIAESTSADTAESKEQITKIGEESAIIKSKIDAIELAKTADDKKMQSEIDLLKSDYDTLYKKTRGLGESESNEAVSAYHAEFSKYIRKGVIPNDDSLNEIATQYVSKTIDAKDEHDFNNAVYQMKTEQGPESGKGFYMLNDLKTMRTGNDPDGGYLTAVDRRADTTVTREFETSPMRAISQILTTGSGEVEIIIDDNESTSGGWVGEETAPTTTAQAQVGLLKIAIHEQFAEPKVTQKMLDDAFLNVEQWLSNKTNDILTRTENTAFVTGDGSQKPKGFLSYNAWAVAGTYERNKLEQVNSGSAGAVNADGLIELQNALLEGYQAGASFLMKRATFGDVSKLKNGNGEYLLNTMMLPQGASTTLLGKPIYFADDMQAVAADALAIAYGDFGVGYTIVDRIGLRVLRDPLTAKPYIKFYTTKRVGGAVTNYQAIKIQKLAA